MYVQLVSSVYNVILVGVLNQSVLHIPNMKTVENPSPVVLDCTFTMY